MYLGLHSFLFPVVEQLTYRISEISISLGHLSGVVPSSNRRIVNGSHGDLDSTYPWSKTEMIAEDFRLMFSSPTALTQWPGQMNSDIPDARDVPGLADFLQNVWGGG